MGEIVAGFDPARIRTLREEGHFFWLDLRAADTRDGDLGASLEIPQDGLERMLALGADLRPSRKFHVDGEHVAFAFSCFLDDGAIDVHVVVTSEWILTVHEEAVALPHVLAVELPEGRSPESLVYAVLDAMIATAWDELNEVERLLAPLQLNPEARIGAPVLRRINSRLALLRQRMGPQRGTFERVGEEIAQVGGLEPESVRNFERVSAQLNRLIGAIDAVATGIAQLIDLRVNETSYALTVVATVFLPLTFVTGFFGMNFGWMVRHITSPLAFVVLGVGGCAVGAALALLAVRYRGTPVESGDTD